MRISVGGCLSVLACASALYVNAARAATETILYSFCLGGDDCSDGAYPAAPLTDVNGTLFGTTAFGGTANDDGTVFALDPETGKETVLHAFLGGADGEAPLGGLIDVNGTLYGTTYYGANAGCADTCGTVFALDPETGKETVLHAFAGRSRTDGGNPAAGLLQVDGKLYGTTEIGGGSGCGPPGCGTVFALDLRTGKEKVLYAFTGGQGGAYPIASLINMGDTLYGTTVQGGIGCSGSGGCGTLFAVDRKTGKETLLYSFAGGADGAAPSANVVDVNGTLYGTTELGGSTGCDEGAGCGAVFAFNLKTGKETVVYAFTGAPGDGAFPLAGLIDVKGSLYGTTMGGGDICEGTGCGTVFALNLKTNKETVLFSVQSFPDAGLIKDASGNFYGTTSAGGGEGYGTVFSFKR
jgi:uncharacterized repeat protein (TIGR03803 family)